jgi:DnaJ-class molecular chaperone
MGNPRMLGKMVACGYCGSSGRIDSRSGSYGKTECPVCHGHARITVPTDAKRYSGCNGTGRQYTNFGGITFSRHSTCHGTGWTWQPSITISSQS